MVEFHFNSQLAAKACYGGTELRAQNRRPAVLREAVFREYCISDPILHIKTILLLFRSAPASPSHLPMSELQECLSREGSPSMDHLDISQSAPGSPGNPIYAGSGGMIGHQQMSALVGSTKAQLLLPHASIESGTNGQEYREGKNIILLLTIIILNVVLSYI